MTENREAGPTLSFQILKLEKPVPGADPASPALVAYLQHGAILFAARSRMADGYDPTRGEVVPTGMVTDGEWVWTMADTYYVQTHGFVVPQEFVEHAAQNDYTVPEVSQEWRMAALASMQQSGS